MKAGKNAEHTRLQMTSPNLVFDVKTVTLKMALTLKMARLLGVFVVEKNGKIIFSLCAQLG